MSHFSLPLIFFLSGLGLTYLFPICGFLLTLLMTPWFELFTLQWGLPNQFIIEYMWLGVLIGSVLKNKFSHRLPVHPMLLPCIAACVFTLVKYIPQMGELWELSGSGLSIRKLITSLGDNFLIWDIINNPFHDIAVVQGYAIFVGILWLCFCHIKSNAFSKIRLAWVIVLSSLPVHAVGYLQKWTKLISLFGTVNIGATFQNENHYSYFSGLILLLCIYTYRHSQRVFPGKIISLMIAFLSLLGLILGKGRAAWLALVLSFVLALIFVALIRLGRGSVKMGKNHWQYIFRFTILGAIGTIIVVQIFSLLVRPVDVAIFQNPSLEKLFFASARKPLLLSALESIKLFPFTGLGEGYFFNKAQMRFEVHNIWIDWAMGFGIWILAVVLISILPIIFRWFSLTVIRARVKLGQIFWSSFFLGYLGLCTLPDIYFSFRPLLIISGVVLYLVFDLNDVIRKKSLILLGFIIPSLFAALTFGSPHSRYNLDKSWSWEKHTAPETGRYHWNSLAFWVETQGHQCLRLEIFPILKTGESNFSFTLADEGERLSRFANRTQYKDFLQNKKSGYITLSANQWHKVCWCFTSISKKYLLVLSEKGEYLSLSQSDFGADNRFISFGVSDTKYYERPPDASECERIEDI